MSPAQIVVPGDAIEKTRERAGPGIFEPPGIAPTAEVAGELGSTQRANYVDSNGARYSPAVRDAVIGVVTQKLADSYRVVLQPRSKPVQLGTMAFEGASKKNRPTLAKGDVVFARVVRVDPVKDAEIEAYDSATGKAAGFGQLKGGTIGEIGLAFARQLLLKGHPILEAIGTKFDYEIAIGMNGRVWIKAPDVRASLLILGWIQKAEFVPQAESLKIVQTGKPSQ